MQVTVYGDDGLFGGSQCFNLTTLQTVVRGEVVTPIITVSEDVAANEGVTITYSPTPPALTGGDRYVCARWNSSVNCGGGGWTVKLVTTPAGSYQCKCLHQGTFTQLDVSRISHISANLLVPSPSFFCAHRDFFASRAPSCSAKKEGLGTRLIYAMLDNSTALQVTHFMDGWLAG